MKPKIYLYCISGATSDGDVIGCALAEDGAGLASHMSSSVLWSKRDMGFTESAADNPKHEFYARHYPDGYDLEWIDEKDLVKHKGFQRAFALNQQLTESTPEPRHD